MPSRHRSRQRALQILYQLDVRQQRPEEAIAAFTDSLYTSEAENEESVREPAYDAFMESLVKGTVARSAMIDETITKHSAHWRLERMPAVDRNILRMAVYEMLGEGTPAAVVIDEALELARRFSGDESVKFINGVLDAVRKEFSGQDSPRGKI
jgi:N utilization substance protein B